jgi:large subunit ribosomal protein L19
MAGSQRGGTNRPSMRPVAVSQPIFPAILPQSVPKGAVVSQQILAKVEASSLKSEVPQFAIGDTVDVHTRILEGEKERVQIFNGVVIAKSGSGSRETFTVRRIVAGEGVERKFPIHSPKIAKVEVKRSGVARRAKLYYLRDRVGKSVRLREKRDDVAAAEATAKKAAGKKAAAKSKA